MHPVSTMHNAGNAGSLHANAHHRSSVYSSQRMGGNNNFDGSSSSSQSHSLGTSRSNKSMGRFAADLPQALPVLEGLTKEPDALAGFRRAASLIRHIAPDLFNRAC